MSGIQLIVGLANPGAEYAKTRHNAGAWFVEEIAKDARASMRYEAKFHGLHSKIELDNKPTHLLIPTTYMNRSGQAVAACLSYLKIAPIVLLIAHDDIDLPVGTIRLKFDGGDGGHNGLKDIISHLDSKKFYRLRIGVGRPAHKEVVDYVLKPPAKAERPLIEDAITRGCAILPRLLDGEMQKAMQQLHTIDEE